jgi:hypothetical protein
LKALDGLQSKSNRNFSTNWQLNWRGGIAKPKSTQIDQKVERKLNLARTGLELNLSFGSLQRPGPQTY